MTVKSVLRVHQEVRHGLELCLLFSPSHPKIYFAYCLFYLDIWLLQNTQCSEFDCMFSHSSAEGKKEKQSLLRLDVWRIFNIKNILNIVQSHTSWLHLNRCWWFLVSCVGHTWFFILQWVWPLSTRPSLMFLSLVFEQGETESAWQPTMRPTSSWPAPRMTWRIGWRRSAGSSGLLLVEVSTRTNLAFSS